MSDMFCDIVVFMYNIDIEEFINLNDLVFCDNLYELIEVVDINDDNEIIVNVRIKVMNKYVMGNDIINLDGEIEEIDFVVVVKLFLLLNGFIDECEIFEDEQFYE